MKKYLILFLVSAVLLSIWGCGPNPQEKKMSEFIKNHVETIKPLRKDGALAYWDAAITGKEEAYEKYGELDLKLRTIYSSADDFAVLKELKEFGQIQDELLKRQLDVLYLGYLENQVDSTLLKEMVDLGAEAEQMFNTFRGKIKGQTVTNNEIESILKDETDSRKRKDAWLASKQVGEEVEETLLKLVKARNKAAKSLGFENYHTLSLFTSNQNVDDITNLFNELYELTKEPFANIKAELDGILSDMYGVGVDGLMPWHYHDPFFQETPLVYSLDLDAYYEDKDVVELSKQFFTGINMPVEDILANSSLYEQEGKMPHAFCTDIDHEGDVRILCNVKNNERWMETMMHELGHAVYDKFQDPKTPYLLREPAHIFTTEAIAMLFGRLSRNGAWMQKMLNLSDEERTEIDKVSFKYAQLKQLIFARWAMVMFNFEKELYANPDQDLNSLWWAMVEKYQLVKKPAKRDKADWAAKIHFAIAPCYYHNYLLGELFASQLHNTIVKRELGLDSDKDVAYVGEVAIGSFLREKVFEPGAKYEWNDMITRATGEPLTAKYFVEQFVK